MCSAVHGALSAERVLLRQLPEGTTLQQLHGGLGDDTPATAAAQPDGGQALGTHQRLRQLRQPHVPRALRLARIAASITACRGAGTGSHVQGACQAGWVGALCIA